jgi:hypothetical protein
MKLPDRIFAIGGAGKEIAFTLLEAEWVLRDLLQPRPNPESLKVSILDTAIGERNDDRQRIQDIRTRINEIKADLREDNKNRVGDITIEYKLVTEDIQLTGSIDLIGDDAVPRITAGNGMEESDWWLQPEYINENLDFARGVVRKRGLGKAIYYKAYAEDDQMKTFVDLPDKGKVAIFAGLGGGTGSGILFDLAEELQEQQRTAEITLFAILPNHTEGVKENTNAYAALSELEYLSLNDENLFKDRILLPIDPTGFDGKTGNTIQTGEMLEELDEAIIYLVTAYYNNPDLEDPFNSNPSYAPFTIGIPQILRYNVEAITEGREALRNILDKKEESLQAEEELYTELSRFLAKHYSEPDDESGLRDLDQTDLRERLEKTEELLNFDLFNELEYESVSMFQEIVEDAKSESEAVSDQIDIVSASIRAVDTSAQTGNFVDSIDEHLAEIIERDLQLLSQRKDLFRHRMAVDDSRIRDTLEYIMGADDGSSNPGVKIQRLEAKVEELSEKEERLADRLDETEQELTSIKDEQADKIDRNLRNVMREVEGQLEALEGIRALDVESNISRLQTQLDQYRTTITNADDIESAENADHRELTQTLSEIEDGLERVGIDFQRERQDIEGSLADLRQAREAFLKMNEEEGTFEKITPWTSSTEEEREEAHKDYRMQKNKLDDRDVLSVGTTNQFTVDIEYTGDQILRQVDRRQQDLEKDITGEVQERLEDPDPMVMEDLQAVLEDGVDRGWFEERLRDAFAEELDGTTEIVSRREDLERDLDAATDELDSYESTVDLFQEVNNRRDVFVENLSSFYRERAEYDEDSDRTVSTEDDEYVYMKNIRPVDVFRATGDDSIDNSDLFNSREEKQRVRNNLEELAKNARNEQYTGLARRKFSKDGVRYDGLRVRAAVMSRAVDDVDPEALDFEDVYSGAFDLGASGKRVESPYTSWQYDAGAPWDIGLAVFVDGVFLDNLRKMVQADGYESGYHRRKEELGDDIVSHHSYGLDDGFRVVRDTVLNVEADDDLEFILRDENSIVNDLLDDYVSVTETSSEPEPEPDA